MPSRRAWRTASCATGAGTWDCVPAKVERLEYDPNRSANLALLLYVADQTGQALAVAALLLVSSLRPGGRPGSRRNQIQRE